MSSLLVSREIPFSPLAVFEVTFGVYAILFYTDTWWTLLGEAIPILYSGIRYSILLIALSLLFLRGKTLIRVIKEGGFLWLYIGICVVSLI